VSQAIAAADAGGMIAGSGNGIGGARAFRWTAAGGMENLGALPLGVESGARAISGDGAVVVGYSDSYFGLRAVIWTPTSGMTEIGQHLALHGVYPAGWTLFDARGVSASGLVIAGTGAGPDGQRAWIAKLPAAPCYANCDGSGTAPILNINDMTCFMNLYLSGSTAANCDGSTSAPVLNIRDFLCFQSKFAAGCP